MFFHKFVSKFVLILKFLLKEILIYFIRKYVTFSMYIRRKKNMPPHNNSTASDRIRVYCYVRINNDAMHRNSVKEEGGDTGQLPQHSNRNICVI